MKQSAIKNLLNLWESNNLISSEQNININEFMKNRQKETFFRFLKWLSIFGAVWLIIGTIITIYNIFEMNFMQKIIEFLSYFFSVIIQFVITYIWNPIYKIAFLVFGENVKYFGGGILSFVLFVIFNYFASKYKFDKDIEKANLTDEQKNILKTNFVLDTLAAFSLAGTFCFFNMLLIPYDDYYSENKIFPYINILGAISFIILAYRYSKSMYLLFGIYFICLSTGMFAGYGYATYWIGLSKPIVQILIAMIILLVGYITELKIADKDNFIKEKFVNIYNWTGLFMLFITLWVSSLWGFDLSLTNTLPTTLELWVANILFIGASLASMYYATITEKKLFFNYGLTFFIIETYTVFCSRIWSNLPIGIASLILGGMLIGTVKILKHIYLQKLQ